MHAPFHPDAHDAPMRVMPEPVPPPPPPPPKQVPTRAILLALVGVLFVVAIVMFAYLKPRPALKARSIGARLDLAAGDVTVKDGADTKALSGTPVGAGATISTGKGARALVRTGEGAAIFLRGDTSLRLLERGVDLGAGEIWLDAPPAGGDAIECKVGDLVVSAADAGTSVKREGNDVTVYVARGLAVLTSPRGRVEINAGEQGKSSGGAKPLVSPVTFWQDWTGGMSDASAKAGARFVGSGTGRLYGLDPNAAAGAPAKALSIAKQLVHAVIRDGIAETSVDQTFSNPGGAPIEGWYWFSIPLQATVTGFALETNGVLVEGEVIEKREAEARYRGAVHTSNNPALLEWVDGRTYRARIYPVPASGTRRVVLRYMEMLPMVEGKTRYVYPLRFDDPVRFDEFALSVDVSNGDQHVDVVLLFDVCVEQNGCVVSM